MIVRVITVLGLLGLASFTLHYPGATRMHASPWQIGYGVALLAPALVLLVRAADGRRPFVLPPRGWHALACVTVGTTLLAAMLSPYRGPSVLWSAPLLAAIAVFFVGYDWLHGGEKDGAARRAALRNALMVVFATFAAVSLVSWCSNIPAVGFRAAVAARNAYPLGHTNYTAGIAILMLGFSGMEVIRARGAARILAGLLLVLALVMLFTSGSRGGLIGLIAMMVAALWLAPLSRKQKWLATLACGAAALAFVAANPRLRETFLPPPEGTTLTISEVQRSAMAVGGLRMGRERPLFGWGPGTTPLAYPRFRGGLSGGVENALQLHSLPLQIWAELGLAGIACLLAFVVLLARARQFDFATIALVGYGAFALTDWQLDVPIFGLLIATFAAAAAPPPLQRMTNDPPRASAPRALGVGALATLAAVAAAGRQDPTPALNVTALGLASEPASHDRAIALLRQSLALNPDQELAHFNLGWLLLVNDPAAAEAHFHAAARLVPDKGGVYFGLGLARLNQGKSGLAARALALECLNDPAFLSSPWWREPAIAALREPTARVYGQFLATPEVARHKSAPSIDRVGQVPDGPERRYRRTRSGYPVLMRNLDLAAPIDLYDVRESGGQSDPSPPLPTKGWLPSPFLLSLLDAPAASLP